MEFLNLQAKTDENGHFKVPFTPQPAEPHQPDPLPARFSVEIEARDTGGRTITAQKSYVAGKNAYLFSFDPDAGFFITGKPSAIQTKILNLNEQLIESRKSSR